MPRERITRRQIGIIIPTNFEFAILEPTIKTLENVKVVVSGMGKLNTAIATMSLLDEGCSAFMLTGLCGGVRGLKVGDTIVVNKVIEGDFDSRGLEHKSDIKYHTIVVGSHAKGCTMVCQDRILIKDEYKDKIKDKVLATDMESYSMALVLSKRQVPFIISKVVSDIVNKESATEFLGVSESIKESVRRSLLECYTYQRSQAD